MKIENSDSILFIGDSITDCDRVRPVGMRDWLGESYVAFVNALLAANYPERDIKVLNTGTSGNRIIDLEARWQTDVLDLAPDWLSIMIGINDVWMLMVRLLSSLQMSLMRFLLMCKRHLTVILPIGRLSRFAVIEFIPTRRVI